MPLSEHEQRLLEQMERALYAEDPKFASSLREGSGRRGNRRHVAIGVLLVLAGLALMVVGVASSLVVVGVLGFLVMFGGAYLAVRALRAPAPSAEAGAQAATPAGAAAAAAPKQKKTGGFMDRVEDRWRRRRDDQGGH